MNYYVYILTNDFNKVLYTGMTNNLERRLHKHKDGHVEGFTKKYRTSKLVYFEVYNDPENAIMREKQIKNWNRAKKLFLINKENPAWSDLSHTWYNLSDPSTMLRSARDDISA